MPTADSKKRSTVSDVSLTSVGEAEAIDPSLYEQIVQPWELINTPTECGNFDYRIRYLTMPGITLYREQFDLGCHVQGLSPANVFVQSVPLQLSSRTTYWNAPACVDQAWGERPEFC